jgi:hypothetical protein
LHILQSISLKSLYFGHLWGVGTVNSVNRGRTEVFENLGSTPKFHDP